MRNILLDKKRAKMRLLKKAVMKKGKHLKTKEKRTHLKHREEDTDQEASNKKRVTKDDLKTHLKQTDKRLKQKDALLRSRRQEIKSLKDSLAKKSELLKQKGRLLDKLQSNTDHHKSRKKGGDDTKARKKDATSNKAHSNTEQSDDTELRQKLVQAYHLVKKRNAKLERYQWRNQMLTRGVNQKDEQLYQMEEAIKRSWSDQRSDQRSRTIS